MHPWSTQCSQRHDIWNHQYGQRSVILKKKIYVDNSTTPHTAAVIELVILLLSLVGIRRASLHGDSRLARLLKIQCITYFVLAFLIQVSAIVSYVSSPEANIRSHLDSKATGQAHIDSTLWS